MSGIRDSTGNNMFPSVAELWTYVVEMTVLEAKSVASWLVVLTLGNFIVLFLVFILFIILLIYSFVAGLFHFFTGISIALGAWESTLLSVVYFLATIVVSLAAGVVATDPFYEVLDTLTLNADSVRYPWLSVVVPIVAAVVITGFGPFFGLLGSGPLVTGLCALWVVLRVAGFFQFPSVTDVDNKELFRGSSVLLAILAAGWLGVAATVVGTRVILPDAFVQVLLAGIETIPLVHPTSTFALGGTLTLGTGLLCLFLLREITPLLAEVVLLRPRNSRSTK